jgi:Fur family transcriptional regulator, ferric uptake regulator
MVCLNCGGIEEFFDKTIEDRQDKVAEERGFKITDHSLILYGRCKACSDSG